MKTKHTEGKLSVDYSGPARLALNDSTGRQIACLSLQCEDGDEDEANAARLALCWNTHDELVEALRNLVAEYDSEILHEWDGNSKCSSLLAKADPARAVLRKVEE